MSLMDYYLLMGLTVHIAFLALVDWLAYRHLVTHGYDHTILLLAFLNIGIFYGLYYLIFQPLRRQVLRRKQARTARRRTDATLGKQQ